MKSYVASHLKDMNRKTVYQLLLSEGEISKAEISRKTGISAPTVIKIIDYFKEIEFVFEAGEGESFLGRKPQMLRFNPEAVFTIGIEYEGVHLKTGLVDLGGNIKYFKKFNATPDVNLIMKQELAIKIDSLINESGISREKIKGICIGIPGVVDSFRRIIDFAPLVGIKEKMDCGILLDCLAEQLKIPVMIENDANAAAIGEFASRKLDETADLLYISLGRGLGAGLILNGKLRRGRRFSSGEIGYMVFDNEFFSSKQQAGWLESRMDLGELWDEWISLRQNLNNMTNTKNNSNLGITDVLKHETIERVASYLALCITNICTFIDMDNVVLGGVGTEEFGEILNGAVNRKLGQLSILDLNCQLQKSPEPGVVGTAYIATKNILEKLLI